MDTLFAYVRTVHAIARRLESAHTPPAQQPPSSPTGAPAVGQPGSEQPGISLAETAALVEGGLSALRKISTRSGGGRGACGLPSHFRRVRGNASQSVVRMYSVRTDGAGIGVEATLAEQELDLGMEWSTQQGLFFGCRLGLTKTYSPFHSELGDIARLQ